MLILTMNCRWMKVIFDRGLGHRLHPTTLLDDYGAMLSQVNYLSLFLLLFQVNSRAHRQRKLEGFSMIRVMEKPVAFLASLPGNAKISCLFLLGRHVLSLSTVCNSFLSLVRQWACTG